MTSLWKKVTDLRFEVDCNVTLCFGGESSTRRCQNKGGITVKLKSRLQFAEKEKVEEIQHLSNRDMRIFSLSLEMVTAGGGLSAKLWANPSKRGYLCWGLLPPPSKEAWGI